MNTLAAFRTQHPHAEVIAVVLPDGTPDQPESLTDFVATGTMLLVRHDDGRVALEPVRRSAGIARQTSQISAPRRGRPIVDPVSREVMGYEMDVAPSTWA